MRRTFLLLVAVLPLALTAEEVSLPKDPDHLEPVNPHPTERSMRYRSQIRKHLRTDESYRIQMLVRPSFDPEYVVRIERAAADEFDASTENDRVMSIRPNQSIFYSMPESYGIDPKTKERLKQSDLKTTKISAPIPSEISSKLEESWQKMLASVRYPEEEYPGEDGTIYEFSTWPNRFGEIWSPEEKKSPLLLIRIGEALIEYCHAKPEERERAIKVIEIRIKSLNDYLEKE